MLSSFVSVDTETTGLDHEHDRIIELAAVRFENGVPVADFTALLSPGDRALSPVARLITGITDEELETAPPRAETLQGFLDFVGDSPLVAHNAEFDAHFVRRALEAEGLPAVPGPWLDSLLLSRIAWPTWDSHRLDSLAERLAVPRDDEHRALPDARRAGYVFIAAHKHVQTSLSPAGQAQLAHLAAELPDWKLVFTNAEDAGGKGAPVPDAAGEDGKATGLFETSGYFVAGAQALATELEALVADETWLALETPPGLDETQAALAGVLEHLAHAGAGQRILLAVPDTFAWNAARKNAPASSVTVTALAEPAGYLCRARLAALVADPSRLPPEERTALLPLVAWADRNPEGPVADGRGFSPERARLTWSRVQCDAWHDDPAAQSAYDAAAKSDLILVTHATLCAHVARAGALLPACDAVIVTGAHRYPDAAQSPAGAGRAISLFRLRDILQSETSDEAAAGEQDPWFAPDRELQKFLQKVGKQAGRHSNDFRVRYTTSIPSAFGVDVAPLVEALKANEAVATITPRTRARLHAFHADFAFLTAAEEPESVYWLEDGANPHKTTLRSVPRGMEAFGDALRALFGAGLFLSPTLLAGGESERDARPFLRAAGLQASPDSGAAAVTVRRLRPARPDDGPPDPDEIASPAFLMAPFASAPRAGAEMQAYARFLFDAARPFCDRGVLVFCPSQTAVRALHGALRNLLDTQTPEEAAPRVYAQWIDGNRDAITRLYAAGRGGFVIASEGLPGLRDDEGRAPAVWALTRMPLPPPRDPVLEARGEPLREEGHNARGELWQPAAVLRIKREWAMLHRGLVPGTADAPKAIWLLDARAATEGLGARLATALNLKAEVATTAEELEEKTGAALRPQP